MEYTTTNGSDNDDLSAFLNELVDFENMVWFNHAMRTWEPFEVGDVFIRPLGADYAKTLKVSNIALENGWELYNA